MTTEDQAIYDPETESWRPVGDDDKWSVVGDEVPVNESAPPTDSGDSVVTPNCRDIGKRHKYKDRQTGEVHDYCLRCGESKVDATAGTAQPRSVPATPRATGKRAQTLDTILGGLWFGAGAAIKTWVPEPAGPPVGKMLQIESAIAGPKLHKILKKTPLYPYIVVAESQVGWLADLGMLLFPPILIGLAASQPKIAQQFKPLLVGMLTPVLAEVAKSAQQQAALLSMMDTYDAEMVEAATAIVNDLIGSDDEKDEV